MPSFRTGTVTAVLSERAGLQRVTVDDEPAYVLTGLIGPVRLGDRVVVNTTAVELGLGTGGSHVVHWNLERESWSERGPGHVLKLRYTSLQADIGVAEENADPARATSDLASRPVVACALHSQVACVAAAFSLVAPDRRLVYVMTDAAALPLAISDLVAGLRVAGLVRGTVTCGQAFGGDIEAVNLYSGLLLAVSALGADAVVVAAGPGGVGTGGGVGFSAVDVAHVLDASAALGGRPVVAVRFSDREPRDRHRGVSHHTRSALALTLASAVVPVPSGEPHPDVADHQVVEVEAPDVVAVLAAHGLAVTTMGRSLEDDPRFAQYAGAAGALAAAMCR